jgi:hypothetical protein
MLFFAVFCGFLAEYQLEHKIEKERGRQYIRSFFEDLKTDTAQLGVRMETDSVKLANLHSVHACFDTVQAGGNANPCLGMIIRSSFSYVAFVSNDRTVQQLKNAGGMRLLKKEIADSVISYDIRIRLYQDFESTLLLERQTAVRNKMINLISFNGLRLSRTQQEVDIDNGDAPYLLTSDPQQVNQLFNEIYMYMITFRRRIAMLGELRNRATMMLTFLQDKYSFR